MKKLRIPLSVITLSLLVSPVFAAENLPRKPFGLDALLPEPSQWIVTPLYQYTDFQKVWAGKSKTDITYPEGHGFDQNDFAILTEWGFRTNWAADLTVGFTDLATRAYSDTPGAVRHTRGLMDTQFGVRYLLLNEKDADSPWTPTLTLRAGGIYRGTYEKDFPYAPGNGAVGLEVATMMRKHFGWRGFGGYLTGGYRDLRSGANSQFFATVGFTQVYKCVTLNAGYRHQQDTTGGDAVSTGNSIDGNKITYTSFVKEVNEEVEAGIGYTDHHDRHWQFYWQANFDGRNTGDKDVYGVYVSFPFGGKHKDG